MPRIELMGFPHLLTPLVMGNFFSETERFLVLHFQSWEKTQHRIYCYSSSYDCGPNDGIPCKICGG